MSPEHLCPEDSTPEDVLPVHLTAQRFALADEYLVIDTAERWKLRIHSGRT